MDMDNFSKTLVSWLTHIFPLLISIGLFLGGYLFMAKVYSFFFFVLVTFIVSAVLDKHPKRGFIVGFISVIIMFILNFMFWYNYMQLQEMINLHGTSAGALTDIVGMFGEPLHPLVFFPLIIVAVFGPLLVVWFVKKNRKETTNI